jgi:hypothetical protein
MESQTVEAAAAAAAETVACNGAVQVLSLYNRLRNVNAATTCSSRRSKAAEYA